jgi:GNAT superfamily N-acetyltransferase
MVTVAVDPAFGGKGIGTYLTKLLIENCKKLNFKLFYAECSGAFSTKALVKNGGEVIHSIEYKDWAFGGGMCSKPKYPFAEAKEPHTKINLVVFKNDQ